MKIGLFFQSFIPQGNGTDGNVNSGPSITEGLSWFEYLLFALFNHLQFGESKNLQDLQGDTQNQFQNVIKISSQSQEGIAGLGDKNLNLQNTELQEMNLQNDALQEEDSQDKGKQGENQQTGLLLLLPFIFRLAQNRDIVQDKQTVSEKENISSELAFFNREILKELVFKGMPDDTHLIALAEKLKNFTEDKVQLADNKAVESIFVQKDSIQDNTIDLQGKTQVKDIRQEVKQLLAKIFDENKSDKGNEFDFSRNVYSQKNEKQASLSNFFKLAFHEVEKFNSKNNFTFHTNSSKEMKAAFKEEISQNFQEARVENSVEKGVEQSIARGKNEGFKSNSIEERVLQAYFSVQRDFQPVSLEQQFAMISKQNSRVFHKVHLNELASFIKNFSVELLPEGEKMARLSLEPPELGRLDLEVKVKDKKVEIVAKVEKPEALHEIRQHFHHIKTHFEEAGLQLKEFQLSLAENLAGGGEFLADKKGEGRSSEREKKQAAMEVAGVENEAGETMPLINQKGSYYYIA